MRYPAAERALEARKRRSVNMTWWRGRNLRFVAAIFAGPLLGAAVVAAADAPAHANRLIDSRSPYLLLHADNPVDWPQGQRLPFSGIRRKNGQSLGPFRVYRASRTVCRICPAYGVCTKDRHAGRILWIGPADALLRQHREWMTTEMAKTLYSRRKGLIEPVFGILKEQLGGRRFLLRGLARVQAEFSLLATAFNLRMLWRAAKARRDASSSLGLVPQRS